MILTKIIGEIVALIENIQQSPWIWGILAAAVFTGYVFSIGGLAIWIERKLAGLLQSRMGPTRVGPIGLFQPIADLLKLLGKEDYVPPHGDKTLFKLAPILLIGSLIAAGATIPFSPLLVGKNMNVGILYILALFAFTPIAVFMAGWGSNDKFSLLASLRYVGQYISYEIPISLSIVAVVAMAGSFSLKSIVGMQKNMWFILYQPLGFVIFLIGLHAEGGRIPFDLQESAQELMGGWNVEYSGLRFGLTMIGEYLHLIIGSMLVVTLFLGGWHGPLLPDVIWFIIKSNVIFVLLLWSRWALPRYRVDQAINIGWKVMLPLSILNLFITGILVTLGGVP